VETEAVKIAGSKARHRARGVVAAAGMSWVALLAATTVGVGEVQRVRAAVSADPRKLTASPNGYRLIVQSYPRSSITSGALPAERARPLGSTQRAITREELARGISVDVLDVGGHAGSQEAPVIVAWVENGSADLEFDAFEARPSADAFLGIAVTSGDSSEVVLGRRLNDA
jgi:hypothetical protein